jgi:hypothetical protein
VALSLNLIGGMFVSQSAAFFDDHVEPVRRMAA